MSEDGQLKHSFNLQISYHVFFSSVHGFVSSTVPLRCNDAVSFGLVPVLLYRVESPRNHFSFSQIGCIDRPLDPLEFLVSAWRAQPYLCGFPSLLDVSANLDEAIPGLATLFAGLGIRLMDKREKRDWFDVSMRYVQAGVSARLVVQNSGDCIRNQEAVNRLLQKAAGQPRMTDGYGKPMPEPRMISRVPDEFFRTSRTFIRLLSDQERSLQMFGVGQAGIAPWKHALVCAQKYGIPSLKPAALRDDIVMDVLEHRMAHGAGVMRARPDFAGRDPLEDGFIADVIDFAPDILACWPGGAKLMCEEYGIDRNELEALLAGQSVAGDRLVEDVCNVLAFTWRDGHVEAGGGRVLVACSREAAIAVYNRFSHGGDLEFAAELLPDDRQPDSEWRLFLFWACGGEPTLLVFQRGAASESLLDDGDDGLINRMDALTVRAIFYASMHGIAVIGTARPKQGADLLSQALPLGRGGYRDLLAKAYGAHTGRGLHGLYGT